MCGFLLRSFKYRCQNGESNWRISCEIGCCRFGEVPRIQKPKDEVSKTLPAGMALRSLLRALTLRSDAVGFGDAGEGLLAPIQSPKLPQSRINPKPQAH